MASMLLLSSTTYAVEVSKAHNPAKQMITMSKADTLDMLESAGIEASKVKMLDSGEMVQTEGEFWQWLVAAAIAFLLSGDSRQKNQVNPYYGGYNSPLPARW